MGGYMYQIDHEITVQDAMAALADQSIDIATNAAAGRVKHLKYFPATQTWRAYLNREQIAEGHQPFNVVEAYNNAR